MTKDSVVEAVAKWLFLFLNPILYDWKSLDEKHKRQYRKRARELLELIKREE